MDKRKRTFIGLTLIFLFGGVTVLVIALSSDHWVKVVPRFDLGNNTSDKRNRSGLITYGLFRGKKILNFGTGDRPDEIFGKYYIVLLIAPPLLLLFFLISKKQT